MNIVWNGWMVGGLVEWMGGSLTTFRGVLISLRWFVCMPTVGIPFYIFLISDNFILKQISVFHYENPSSRSWDRFGFKVRIWFLPLSSALAQKECSEWISWNSAVGKGRKEETVERSWMCMARRSGGMWKYPCIMWNVEKIRWNYLFTLRILNHFLFMIHWINGLALPFVEQDGSGYMHAWETETVEAETDPFRMRWMWERESKSI